jgi:hypothetical protein
MQERLSVKSFALSVKLNYDSNINFQEQIAFFPRR